MADQPDPPEWRVYDGDSTPEPETPTTEEAPTPSWVAPPPDVLYGAPPTQSRVVRSRSGSGAGLIVLAVVLVVVGSVGIGVYSFIREISGAFDDVTNSNRAEPVDPKDPKDPKDFAEMVTELKAETGSTEVFFVGLYDGYAVIDVPFAKAKSDLRKITYRWDGAGFSTFTKGTATDPGRFDVGAINPQVIDGMCDPVLALADGATSGDCYVFINPPKPGSKTRFRAGASDEFNQYFSVDYDLKGREVGRSPQP